jgi:transposase
LPLDQAHIAERRQVFDVPVMAFDVIEHRTLEVVCTCGQVHVSNFPVGLN